MNKITRYAAERMTRELNLNDLREEVKWAASKGDIESIIQNHLLEDTDPSVKWSFESESDARSALNGGYGFRAYPSNGLIDISGNAVEEYQEDEDGDFCGSDGNYTFDSFTEKDLFALLHELKIEPDSRCYMWEIPAYAATDYGWNEPLYAEILANWYGNHQAIADFDRNDVGGYSFKINGSEYSLNPVYEDGAEEPTAWEVV